jgi:cystathionine beta-lyase
MLHYVEGNVDYVIDFCQRHLPEIRPLRPEASFLIWMDCRALGLSRKDLVALFVDKARLALNDGAIFGPGGEGFMRLNVGAPRATIVEAMTRLERAVRG